MYQISSSGVTPPLPIPPSPPNKPPITAPYCSSTTQLGNWLTRRRSEGNPARPPDHLIRPALSAPSVLPLLNQPGRMNGRRSTGFAHCVHCGGGPRRKDGTRSGVIGYPVWVTCRRRIPPLSDGDGGSEVVMAHMHQVLRVRAKPTSSFAAVTSGKVV